MLIKNCMLIDGADIFEEMKDIRIVNGKIKEVADCLMPEGDEEIIDAEGALVTPGWASTARSIDSRKTMPMRRAPLFQSCGPTTP